MESLNNTLVLAAALLTPVITLILGMLQAKVQQNRIQMNNRLNEASSAKMQGEAWEKLTNSLQEALKRIREESEAKEKEFLEQIDKLQAQMQENERKWNIEKIALQERIATLERKNKMLQLDIEKLKKDTGELKGESYE